MKKKQPRFSPEFKTRVAIEALRGRGTLQEIADRHAIHPDQVSAWKWQALEYLEAIFSKSGSDSALREAELQELRAAIRRME